MKAWMSSNFGKFATELLPLINVRIEFLLNILKTNRLIKTKFCIHIIIDKIYFGIVNCCYTPGIYADGYIVFAFPFVRSYVRSFVIPSRSWNLRPSFALKFLKWCISQQLLIRKHSYLDHSYPGGLAFTP